MTPDEILERPARLAALQSVGILDTPREEEFDDICALAAHLCDVPFAVVNFLDAERQWFKSEVGLGCDTLPLPVSICRHAVATEYAEFPDLSADARFSANPLVAGEPGLRFYAGAAVRVDGEAVGTVCVLDTRPRQLNAAQSRGLRTLATQVTKLLDLRRRLRQKEDAAAAKDQFLAKLSHELRTPLTPVLMAVSGLLEVGVDDPDLREDLAMILRNVQTEARLIDDLLDVTRIAHGKMVLRRETMDLHAVVRQALDVCAGRFRERGIALDVALDAPSSQVHGDALRLQQTFWNLADNAAKFTPAGGRIAVTSENPAPGRICVAVRDNGRGIEPERLTSLFDAFEQGGAETTRTHGGLGLGLAICRGMVEMHGGSIRATSSGPGHGTTMLVELATTGGSDLAPQTELAPPRQPEARLLAGDHAGIA